MQLFEIAKLKVKDSEEMSLLPVQKVFKTIAHQCKGMGIKVDYRNEAAFAAEAGAAATGAAKKK